MGGVVAFLLGLFVGGIVGFFTAALMAAAGRGDEFERLVHLERAERLRRDREHDAKRRPNGHDGPAAGP